MAGTVTSSVTTVTGIDYVNIQAVWTGTPTGSFDFQASHDQATWTSLAFANPFTATGAAGNLMADIKLSAPYLRVVYTPTSGSGTLNVSITGNTVGA